MRIRCLVEGCLGGSSNRNNPRVHFVHCHMQDTIMIMEEEKRPYPRCPKCDMYMSHKALNDQHLSTAFFRWEEERKWHRLVEEEAWTGAEVDITSYGIPLSQVTYFKYLGRFILTEDNDCPEVCSSVPSLVSTRVSHAHFFRAI